jgi:putative ABC transport system substrate-binding protein
VRRREFIALVGSAAAAWPGSPCAQGAAKIARVGILSGASLATPANARFRKAFVDVLRQLDWDEGNNLIVEARATEGRPERYAEFAAELVSLNVDVAVGSGSQGVQALKDKTSIIPIVMLDASHPVEAGFVTSLARPGGNITGVTPQLNEINAKAVELLRDVVPGLDRVGLLYTPSNLGSALAAKQSLETVPARLGLSLLPIPVDTADDVDRAVATLDRERLRAVHVHPTPVIGTNAARLAALLIERRVLTVTAFSTLVRAGLLASYGPDQAESWRGAAAYVDRILRGAKPADLPVQQPTTFNLAFNLKTARALGVTIPPTMLARADEVIE